MEYNTAKQQREAGQYIEDCPHGYYNLTHFDGDYIQLKINQKKQECPTCKIGLDYYEFIKSPNNLAKLTLEDFARVNEMTSRTSKNALNKYNINHICQKNHDNKLYFVNNELLTFTNINNLFQDSDVVIQHNKIIDIVNTITLDTSKYENVFQNKVMAIDKSIICLEGNIIFADSQSKIGSGSITSCLFIGLILNNDSCIALHLNGTLNNIYSPFNSEIKNNVMNLNFTYDNFDQYINTHFNLVINTIKKIFVGGITSDYFFDHNNNLTYNSSIGESIQSIDMVKLKEIFIRKLGILRNPDQIEIIKINGAKHIIIHNGNIYTFGISL